ncbi:hypothetical protein ACJMK2_026449 [Sinanodonta woodiana]|uniref:Uncharacterized protein n=1 Tax=Sinanodonta woodiana TaxID=1069815 RepID=A0ABD3XJM8_SINWO
MEYLSALSIKKYHLQLDSKCFKDALFRTHSAPSNVFWLQTPNADLQESLAMKQLNQSKQSRKVRFSESAEIIVTDAFTDLDKFKNREETSRGKKEKNNENNNIDGSLSRQTNDYIVCPQLMPTRMADDGSDFDQIIEIGHDNVLFECDNDIIDERGMYIENSFGRKGKDIGEYHEATSVSLDSKGRVLVTDMVNNRVQLCKDDGNTIKVYSVDEMIEPWATCYTNEGHFAVTSRRGKCVFVISADGDVINKFGNNIFQCPSGIAIDKSGRFIVTDIEADRVSIHDINGDFIQYLGDPNDTKQKFSKPRYIHCSVRGDYIISDSGNHCLKVFDSCGNFVSCIGSFGKGDGHLKFPYGICTDPLGDILVADHYNKRISMFSREGQFVRHIVTSKHGLQRPQGIVLTPDLRLFVSHGIIQANEIVVFKLYGYSGNEFQTAMTYV